MTRLLLPAERIVVQTGGDGAPISLTWRDRSHLVIDVVSRWRVDTEWWRGRQWRECFTIATSTKLLLTIYRDLSRGEWYVQRIFD